ncbi:MAG: response regulator, partial [Sorangiineae bacterium PRO1]|nr:response regulator [Sorangiineae bacterium PRO1]
GAGIAPKDLSRVFDAFFTTKPVGQGTGLGLAICRNIVQAMGGSIAVESELGAGTTVRISLLPAAEEESPASHTSTISPLKPLDDALRVLVVDDEPLIGRAVARCLGKHNQVRWVSSGREALEVLDTEHFDVVFLDVMMPDMTGIDLYEQLSARAPEIVPRIVFVTGGAFTASARVFLERVPNRQVGKPFEARHLRAVAQEVAALAGTGQIDRRRSC